MADSNLLRPISLTSVACQVLEAILKEKMPAHLSQFSLLTSRQHGFLPRRSTLSNLLAVEKLASKWLDEGSAVDMIVIEFSKAFDSANLLLDKLRGYGIDLVVISWVECFLSRRTFQVNVNGTLSQAAEAISGVPQGSVISPILFVIYVNYLLDRLSADDVKLSVSRNRNDVLQNSPNISASRSKDWELDFNPTKSEHFPLVSPPISSLTPTSPITHPPPRPYQQSPPPKTWELS